MFINRKNAKCQLTIKSIELIQIIKKMSLQNLKSKYMDFIKFLSGYMKNVIRRKF